MANITIVFGLLLILLGPVGYFGSGSATPSLTAFIPSAVGLLLLICGLLAKKDNLRKHAMHAAAMFGTLGFLGGVGNIIRVLAAGEIKLPLAFAMTVAMTVLCAIFVGLCVRSFIQARRAREAKSAT